MTYFERVFQEIWLQIKRQILYRTYVLQNNHFQTKLPLAAYGTFLFSKFGMESLESFSFELIEAIVRKCSKKGGFEILEELIRNHPQRNTTSDNRM